MKGRVQRELLSLMVSRPVPCEIVDLVHATHPPESNLSEETDGIVCLNENTDIDAERQRRCLIVEVGGLLRQVRTRCDQGDVGLVDEAQADQRLAVAAHLGVDVAVLTHAEIEREALVIRVLAVQVGRTDLTHGGEIGVERLEREGRADFRIAVQHVAAAKAKVEPGAVDVFVTVLRNDRRHVVQCADGARVDVAADAVVPAEAEVDAPGHLGVRVSGLGVRG